MLAERRLELIFDQNPPHFWPENGESAVFLCAENAAKAKNLLGQEFERIGYDCRQGINLDALAIAAGTLKAGGTLRLCLDKNLQTDLDSLRWSGKTQAIATPNFYRHFYSVLKAVDWDCQPSFEALNAEIADKSQPTNEQQVIIEQILQSNAEIFILTAKRGRGKSALAGFLAQQLRHKNPQQKIWLTAPNKSAVKILQEFSQAPLEFIAPDELCLQLKQNSPQFAANWLFIDEAAMIPLPLLFQFTSAFKQIFFATTIHSYEGTGRGFLLKFLPNLHRTFQQFELIKPLRWAENDKLEKCIEDLLLLEAENRLPSLPVQAKSAVKSFPVSQEEVIENIADFYGLLTLAHYRTSPVDLRRLLDAPKQQFWLATVDNRLVGAVWLVEEGGLQEAELIAQICEGSRRPKGNLVAQKLAHEQLNGDFLRQKSLRISRIAILPSWQRQGLGQKMLAEIAEQANADFLSVSFGYTPELAAFWQKCGFNLVHIGDNREASSGCYGAIALREIQDSSLVKQSAVDFQRDFALREHKLKLQIQLENPQNQWDFTEKDREKLQNFVKNYRTFFSAQPAIRRLLKQAGQNEQAFFEMFSTIKEKKAQLNFIRNQIGGLLTY